MTQQTQDPLAVHAGEGEAFWWLGCLAVIKATAADTGGQMTIIEVTEPPGGEAPLHVHHNEDEGFWLLEGDATFEIGDPTIQLHAGDYVYGHETSRTATQSGRPAAGCCSSSPPADSGAWSER